MASREQLVEQIRLGVGEIQAGLATIDPSDDAALEELARAFDEHAKAVRLLLAERGS